MKKRLIILGSTGSIGTKALEVVSDFPDQFEIVALSTNSQIELLEKQAAKFRPKAICVCSAAENARGQKAAESTGAVFHAGVSGLVDLVTQYDADMVLVATVGFVGLAPTVAAIRRGITIALANKEVLVTAGDLVMKLAREHKVDILPVDSEHNAVFQCLHGSRPGQMRRVILTASGGPFRGMKAGQLGTITPADALRHPTWNMGSKITIDSATLMNKGFEVIEAAHLFGISVENVSVVIHPQSIVHSMVEFIDGSILAQMGVTDMYFPIQNVLLYPERFENRFPSLNFSGLGSLTFEEPDPETFPCLRYAYEAAEAGGTRPAALNAANEIAVARFLNHEVPFLAIPEVIYDVLSHHENRTDATLDEIQSTDQWARGRAGRFAPALSH